MHLSVQKFSKDKHLETLKAWQKEWGLWDYPWDLLPENGWVAYNHDDPVAIVFARLCEKQTLLFDHVISTPNKTLDIRRAVNKAIDAIFEEMEAFAVRNNIRLVLGWTDQPAVLRKAAAHGFVTYPSTITVRVR